MLFFNNKKISKPRKLFLGAFLAWFVFINLALPIRAWAVEPNNGDTGFAPGTDGTTQIINADGTISIINPAAAATDPKVFASATGEAGVGVGDLAKNSIAALGTCSIGAILGQILSSLIAQIVSGIVSTVAKSVIQPITNAISGTIQNKVITPITGTVTSAVGDVAGGAIGIAAGGAGGGIF